MSAQFSFEPETRPQKLRILQVVPTYFPAVRYGGPIRSVHGLAAGLARRGHDVHVFTTSVDGESDLQVPHDRAVDLDGVQVQYFRVPALRRLYWSPSMKSHLRMTIRTFDIVHLHSIYLWPIAMAAREAERTRVPYFMSPRGMLVRDVIERKNRLIKSAWINLFEKRSLRAAAGLHVTAELEAVEANALGLELPPAFCIANGIDIPSSHSPLADGPFAAIKRPYVLFLSRISWKKGLDRLIKAWRFVPNLQLLIAGNDDENYVPQLKAMPEYAEVQDRVVFAGAVSDQHKWALYKNAEMFVLPSYSENFGNVVAEAMAMSCPVILTPEVGIAEFVRTHDAGMITSGEPSQLAETVRALHDNPQLRSTLGSNGKAAVVRHLSWDAIAREMESAYLSVQGSKL